MKAKAVTEMGMHPSDHYTCWFNSELQRRELHGRIQHKSPKIPKEINIYEILNRFFSKAIFPLHFNFTPVFSRFWYGFRWNDSFSKFTSGTISFLVFHYDFLKFFWPFIEWSQVQYPKFHGNYLLKVLIKIIQIYNFKEVLPSHFLVFKKLVYNT